MNNLYRTLKTKIRNKKAVIAVVGLGYVGLPLALTFCKKFSVIGFDVSKKKINLLNKNKSYISDASSTKLKKVLNKKFFPTTKEEELNNADFIIIAVPTPLDKAKRPDLSYIKSASEIVTRNLKKGQFIILESTTYPGTTEDFMIPILEKSGFKAGIDFGVAFSPERVDPGNKKWNTENTPKVVGGFGKEAGDVATLLYSSVIKALIHTVSGCKEAEAAKILENTFREVNIALINELALMFERMGINIWEVVNAAATKPHSFMPHYPGPGVGGHCIPLDPYYLLYEAEKSETYSRFIELAGIINDHMKIHAINLAYDGLKNVNKKLNNSTVGVLGLAYKKDINDARESPAFEIVSELVKRGAIVKVFDPFVKRISTEVGEFESERNMLNCVEGCDCLIFLTNHSQFSKINWNKVASLMKDKPVLIDTRNMFNPIKGFVYKAIGKP